MGVRVCSGNPWSPNFVLWLHVVSPIASSRFCEVFSLSVFAQIIVVSDLFLFFLVCEVVGLLVGCTVPGLSDRYHVNGARSGLSREVRVWLRGAVEDTLIGSVCVIIWPACCVSSVVIFIEKPSQSMGGQSLSSRIRSSSLVFLVEL